MIEKLEMKLTRQNGEWAIAISPKNAPNAQEVRFIKANRDEILKELKSIKDEKLAAEKEKRENAPIKVKLEKVNEYEERYIVKENKEMAEKLGIGKQVGYWGVVVDEDIIKELGTEFTAEQIRNYLNNKKENAPTGKEKLETLIEQAKVLGHKVEIETTNVKCDGTVAECDLDILTRSIDGKGEITTARVHTH